LADSAIKKKKETFCLSHDYFKTMCRIFKLSRYVLSCLVLLFCTLSCSKDTVIINSCILRNRVTVLDRVLMKKALYVAFSMTGGSGISEKLRTTGRLLCNESFVAESLPSAIQGKNGNLIFDLPYQIPAGKCEIRIDVTKSDGIPVAHGSLTVNKSDLESSPETGNTVPDLPQQDNVLIPEQDAINPTRRDIAAGYVIFSRSLLEYIYPESRPKKSEIIDHILIRAVQNEFEPISFALYPLRNLGIVRVAVSHLYGPAGSSIASNKLRIGFIDSVQETRGMPEGKFRNLPSTIKPGNRVTVEEKKCRRFWLTLAIDQGVLPGLYKGSIIVIPQFGKRRIVPLSVNVGPLSLEEIPRKDYFMLMTYEFTELSMPWKKKEKTAIYQAADNIVKDYKNHGMTTLCIHSPFVYIENGDGTPNLDDLYAALKAAKDNGFTRPLIWYMGHLIQTSKPKHPGSIRGFDESVDLPRLEHLVKTVTEYTRSKGYPDVIFLPIDEPDDSSQDIQKKRREITPLLLKTIHDAGGKTMLTTRTFSQFQPFDYISSSTLDENELRAAHERGSIYWMYNNRVSEVCTNPAYARYVYGYYTWKNNIDGMSSWTFQNTQNATGVPASMGGIGRDVYLAYPDPQGPIATITWEAIREGIDDHKLIYQLMQRIQMLKNKGLEAGAFENFIAKISERLREPGCSLDDRAGWTAADFERTRDELITLISDADRLLSNGAVLN
jgi:hypothetical protein